MMRCWLWRYAYLAPSPSQPPGKEFSNLFLAGMDQASGGANHGIAFVILTWRRDASCSIGNFWRKDHQSAYWWIYAIIPPMQAVVSLGVQNARACGCLFRLTTISVYVDWSCLVMMITFDMSTTKALSLTESGSSWSDCDLGSPWRLLSFSCFRRSRNEVPFFLGTKHRRVVGQFLLSSVFEENSRIGSPPTVRPFWLIFFWSLPRPPFRSGIILGPEWSIIIVVVRRSTMTLYAQATTVGALH